MFFAFYFLERKQSIAETKVLRYTRAMTEIISENVAKNSMISEPIIEPLPPAIVRFDDMDGSEYNVGAVNITARIYS